MRLWLCLSKNYSPPWSIAGRAAAFDISVTSPLNTLTLMEARVSAGYAALAAEERKHVANDAKCHELGWICVPLVTESYGAWGSEATTSWPQDSPPYHAGPSPLYLMTFTVG